MSKTRPQLVRRALKEIGIIPLTTESYTGIDELVDGMFASLNDRDIVYVANTASTTAGIIDEELFQPLAQCLAYMAGPEMGVDEPTLERLAAQKERAELDIKKIKSLPYTRQIAEGEYF